MDNNIKLVRDLSLSRPMCEIVTGFLVTYP